MQLFNLKSFALTTVIALGFTLTAVPQSAHADENINWSLLAGDPTNPHRAGCYEQLHKVYLQAGVTYNLDMSSSVFDTYLYLEDLNGNVLGENDDYPGLGQNSRIVFTPSYSGHYNLAATTFQAGALGAYNISVYAQSSAPGFGGPTYQPTTGGQYYPPVTNTQTYYPPVTNTQTYYPPVNNTQTYYPPANNPQKIYQPINGVPGFTTQGSVNGHNWQKWTPTTMPSVNNTNTHFQSVNGVPGYTTQGSVNGHTWQKWTPGKKKP